MEQLTINLTPEAKAALQQRAAAKGQDVREFVEHMVNQQALRPTLDEILAPVRQEFAASGMTEDELDDFLDGVRETIWQEKQPRQG